MVISGGKWLSSEPSVVRRFSKYDLVRFLMSLDRVKHQQTTHGTLCSLFYEMLSVSVCHPSGRDFAVFYPVLGHVELGSCARESNACLRESRIKPVWIYHLISSCQVNTSTNCWGLCGVSCHTLWHLNGTLSARDEPRTQLKLMNLTHYPSILF